MTNYVAPAKYGTKKPPGLATGRLFVFLGAKA
jgi:hypothetical protein